MWRGVKAYSLWKTRPLPVRSEKGIDESTCAPFPLCSGNVNNIQLVYIGILRLLLKLKLKAASSKKHLPDGQDVSTMISCLID